MECVDCGSYVKPGKKLCGECLDERVSHAVDDEDCICWISKDVCPVHGMKGD